MQSPSVVTPGKNVAFLNLLNKHSCGCGRSECTTLLEQYFNDDASPYPEGPTKKQLLFHVGNPRKSATGDRYKKWNLRRQQIFDRVIKLLKPANIENPHDLTGVHIGIVHFHPSVINHFFNDGARSNTKFVEYLLPLDLVRLSNLGVEFTDVDRFLCLGTNAEDGLCTKAEKVIKKTLGDAYKPSTLCNCKRFINVPFVTKDRASDVIIGTPASSSRSRRMAVFSESRSKELAPKESIIQSQRAANRKRERDVARSELDDVRKRLQSEQEKNSAIKKMTNTAQLRSRIHELSEESMCWKQKYYTELDGKRHVIAERDHLSNKYQKVDSKLKVLQKRELRNAEKQSSAVAPEDVDLSDSDISRMGMCRRSLLDHQWHKKWKDAARSLFNFESFDECLIYIGVFFPRLRNDIKRLKAHGARVLTTGAYLTGLEQCLLSRTSNKIGINDQQIGFIWGIGASAVSKIKKHWMPQWGYVGRALTDLELYADYVEKERPNEYVDNDLGDCGCQCDGKDFMTESFRKNSALNRAQQSSKMKHPALRCITWSSLCGLVWAMTPLVLSRVTENALVQWFGRFDTEDEMYVPVNRADWLVSGVNEEEIDVLVEDDCEEMPVDDDCEMSSVFESLNSTTEEDNDSEPVVIEVSQIHSEAIYENDEHLKSCRDDMSVGSLSDAGDESLDANDSLINLDEALDKFVESLDAPPSAKAKKKMATEDILRTGEINDLAREFLVSGPDKNGKTKLEQQKLLQELHVLYEEKQLKKCALSMYLKLTTHHRVKLIKDLEDFRDGKVDAAPKIPRRLAKLPAYLKVLADRGFDGDNLSYPHFNMVITPEFMDSETKQFSMAQLQRDRKICELRYTCEVVFSRVTTEEVLSDVIPYTVLAHIEDAFAWAHANANLKKPLKMPGTASGIDESYFK